LDAANGDLHVLPGSPAIDTGTSAGAPSLDWDGNRRPFDGDGDGLAEFDMGVYESQVVDLHPVADAAGPYIVLVGHSVDLSGAGSTDGDGTIVAYEWDLDYNGSTFDVDATGASPSFSAAGLHHGDTRTVALRVTDNGGAVSEIDTATVSVLEASATPGLYDPLTSTFYLRCENTSGVADVAFAFGEAGAGWQPVVGDWNGDRRSDVGFYDWVHGTFYLTTQRQAGYAERVFAFGEPGGRWRPVAGDWNADGQIGVGLYDPQSSTFYMSDRLATGYADSTLGFGQPGANWQPLVGRWTTNDSHSQATTTSAEVVDQLDLAALAAQELAPAVTLTDLNAQPSIA
jgi:PKD repeat protein